MKGQQTRLAAAGKYAPLVVPRGSTTKAANATQSKLDGFVKALQRKSSASSLPQSVTVDWKSRSDSIKKRKRESLADDFDAVDAGKARGPTRQPLQLVPAVETIKASGSGKVQQNDAFPDESQLSYFQQDRTKGTNFIAHLYGLPRGYFKRNSTAKRSTSPKVDNKAAVDDSVEKRPTSPPREARIVTDVEIETESEDDTQRENTMVEASLFQRPDDSAYAEISGPDTVQGMTYQPLSPMTLFQDLPERNALSVREPSNRAKSTEFEKQQTQETQETEPEPEILRKPAVPAESQATQAFNLRMHEATRSQPTEAPPDTFFVLEAEPMDVGTLPFGAEESANNTSQTLQPTYYRAGATYQPLFDETNPMLPRDQSTPHKQPVVLVVGTPTNAGIVVPPTPHTSPLRWNATATQAPQETPTRSPQSSQKVPTSTQATIDDHDRTISDSEPETEMISKKPKVKKVRRSTRRLLANIDDAWLGQKAPEPLIKTLAQSSLFEHFPAISETTDKTPSKDHVDPIQVLRRHIQENRHGEKQKLDVVEDSQSQNNQIWVPASPEKVAASQDEYSEDEDLSTVDVTFATLFQA